MRAKKIIKEASEINKNTIDRFLPLLFAIAISTIIFFLNIGIVGPMNQADESSHLLNASAIAGFPNDHANKYHSGYSLLISIAFLTGDYPDNVWFFVKVINSIIYFGGVLSIFSMAQRLGRNKPRKVVLLAATVVSLYPMWVTMAGYSFSQVAFFSVFSILSRVLLSCYNGGTSRTWFAAGLLSGFLYWIHPLGIIVAIATLLTGIWHGFHRKVYKDIAVMVATLVSMLLFYSFVFEAWLLSLMTISGQPASTHYPSSLSVILRLFDPSLVTTLLAVASGHLLYITMGSLGLIWAFLLCGSSGRRKISIDYPYSFTIFQMLSLLGTFVISVLFMTGASRLDQWMHGRYLEGVIAPLLLLGAMSFSKKTQFISFVITVVSGFVFTMFIGEYGHTARMSVSTFWQDFYLRDYGVGAWVLAGSMLLLLTVVTARISKIFTLLVIALLFLKMSALQVDWHERASIGASSRSASADLVRKSFPTSTCVGFDMSSYSNSVYWFDIGFRLYDFPLLRMTAQEWYENCDGPFFSFRRDLEKVYSGVFLINGGSKGPSLYTKNLLTSNQPYPFKIRRENAASLLLLFGRGWHDFETSRIWSKEKATLRLPSPRDCDSNQCSAEISYSVFGASAEKPKTVTFNVSGPDGEKSSIRSIVDSGELKKALIPLNQSGLTTVQILTPEAESPKSLGLSADARILGISVFRIGLAETYEPSQ
mgnify:CR=1 FL=1